MGRANSPSRPTAHVALLRPCPSRPGAGERPDDRQVRGEVRPGSQDLYCPGVEVCFARTSPDVSLSVPGLSHAHEGPTEHSGVDTEVLRSRSCRAKRDTSPLTDVGFRTSSSDPPPTATEVETRVTLKAGIERPSRGRRDPEPKGRHSHSHHSKWNSWREGRFYEYSGPRLLSFRDSGAGPRTSSTHGTREPTGPVSFTEDSPG